MGDSKLVPLGTSGTIQVEWSPDRAHVKLVQGDGSVDIVQANGGLTRAFPAAGFGEDLFAYTGADGSVNVLSPGGDSVQLAADGQPHLAPTGSVDGQRLIYVDADGATVLIDSKSGAGIARLNAQIQEWNATGTRFLGQSEVPPAGPFTANAEGGEQVSLAAAGVTLADEAGSPTAST